MAEIDPESQWIDLLRADLLPSLRSDRRFVNAQSLLDNFESGVRRSASADGLRQLVEFANELCAAQEILRRIRSDQRLRYEPRLQNTRKSIDFCIEGDDGSRHWIDVKTVAPQWNDSDDAWGNFQSFLERMPQYHSFNVDRNWGGAGIWRNSLKARWSFIHRTIELESKIAQLTSAELGSVRLLFCCNGAWHEDELEDFADFYRSDLFRDDDTFRNAILKRMADEKLSFTKRITGFCFLERKVDAVHASRFVCDVRGPAEFGPTLRNDKP
jgi:hypothetical protein